MPTRSKFTGKSIPSANRWTRSHVNPICKSKEGKAKGTPKKTRTLRVIDGRSASNFGGFSAARLLDYMANDNYLDDDDFDYEDEVSDAYSGSGWGWETRSQTRSIELGYDNSTVGSHYFEEEEVESTGVNGDLNLNGVSCVGILNYTASVDDPVEDSVHDADEALVDLEENEPESTVLDEIEDVDHAAADEDEDDDDPADEDAEYDDDPAEEVEEYSAEEDGEDDDMSFCEVGFVVDQIDGDEEWCLVEEM